MTLARLFVMDKITRDAKKKNACIIPWRQDPSQRNTKPAVSRYNIGYTNYISCDAKKKKSGYNISKQLKTYEFEPKTEYLEIPLTFDVGQSQISLFIKVLFAEDSGQPSYYVKLKSLNAQRIGTD